MNHPIPIGRRAALHDPAFWRPLKGLVSVIAEHFAMEPDAAGTFLAVGMSTGEIGHRVAAPDAQDWIVTPRGAELARLSGLRYDEHINWRDGTMHPPGGRTYPLEVYWPDVERLKRQPGGKTIEGTAEEIEFERPKTGPRPKILQTVQAKMQEALDTRAISFPDLMRLKQESLPELYGGRRATCVAARKNIETNYDKLRRNSSRTSTNDK